MQTSRLRHNRHVVGAICALAIACAACGSSSSTPTTAAPGSTTPHGTADVAYAGSLVKLYNDTLGPAFQKATGDHFGGPPGAGSLALAQEILSGEISPGVFLSVGAKAIKELWPSHAKFALALATDPLVVAYSPKSRYFTQLNAIRSGAKPLSSLFTLLDTSGFRLGRTDPTQDPQGEFFLLMMQLAQRELNLPAGLTTKILGITKSSPYGSSSQMLDEDALPVDIQTGVVDAGSDYLPEAQQYGLDYITLPAGLDFADPADLSTYATASISVAGEAVTGELINLDVTLVAPAKGKSVSAVDATADQAFVAYLLSAGGRAVLAKAGYTLVPPVLKLTTGATKSQALPTSVLSLFNALHGTISTS
ncbi:MAG: substrate-binding domain-containing protein [Acidimicrobiales bacterium]|jgi:molybdate/tungstate transport system substrate-binding protein